MGFRLLTEPEQESHILITLHYPDSPQFDFESLHDTLYKRGFTIYPGKPGKNRTFRLANMGTIDEQDIRAFLDTFQQVLEEMRVFI